VILLRGRAFSERRVHYVLQLDSDAGAAMDEGCEGATLFEVPAHVSKAVQVRKGDFSFLFLFEQWGRPCSTAERVQIVGAGDPALRASD
jgi:hypothetical protein